jgi:hypothetical protein
LDSPSVDKSSSKASVVPEAAASVTSCIANQVGTHKQRKYLVTHPLTPKCTFTTNNIQLTFRCYFSERQYLFRLCSFDTIQQLFYKQFKPRHHLSWLFARFFHFIFNLGSSLALASARGVT